MSSTLFTRPNASDAAQKPMTSWSSRREYRLTIYGLGDRNRGLLYVAVGVTVLTLTATRLLWESAVGTAAWFVLLGAAIWAAVYVYRASREY